jgi:MoxR-like ATPase
MQIQSTVRQVPVSDHVINYTLAIVRQTRVENPELQSGSTTGSAGARGRERSRICLLGAKTRALLSGRTTVSTDDIQNPGWSGNASSYRAELYGSERRHNLGQGY